VVRLPDAFLQRIKHLLGSEAGLFQEYCDRRPPSSIRVNTLKTDVKSVTERLVTQGFTLKPVPWCRPGFFVEGQGISKTVEYFLGHYFIQDAASMIPVEVLKPLPGERILDLTASPGGKSTHITALMENKGLLVANEVNRKRIPPLRFNLSKHGVLNAVVTRMDASRPVKTKMRFDRILLDAPCSGEGIFNTNPESIRQWSTKKIERNARLQKKLISNAASLLKNKGVLVYSTCTLTPEENEAVVDSVLDKGLQIDDIKLQGLETRPGIAEWMGQRFDETLSKCARIYPHLNDTIGFFTARLIKCMD
jgi:NOL1/NOP2/sun family putative RNA methylase